MTACAVMPAVRMPMTKRTTEGFTLVELLLAAALGLMLCGVMAKLLIGEAALSGSLARRIEQKRLQQRTLALIKGDLRGADRWHLDLFTAPLAPCPMAGRRPILSIVPAQGFAPVVYSVGKAPSAIWRGAVLMRCGPAFDLNGRPNYNAAYQNRVLLDAVEDVRATQHPQLPVLQLDIVQIIKDRHGQRQRIGSSAAG
jgi:hypothetical protein